MGAVKNVGALVATREILAAITNWLQDDELEVRARAADAIGSLGTAAAKDEVLTAMIALLNYGVPDPDDRQSISRINDRFEFSNIRAITARAVGSLGAAAATPQIVTALAARLRDDVWTVWRDSAEAVGRLGAGAATPEILAELARELSHWPRSVTAGEALALMGSRAAGATLLSALPCLKRDDRVRAVYNVLTHWSDVRLFRLGDEWKLIPLDDLIQGRYPFIA
jgi:HEAT repeat protein